MPSAELLLATDQGFRVSKSDQQVVFERPAGATSPLLAWLPLGLGFMGVLVGISLIASSFSEPAARGDLRTGAFLLFVLSALAFALGRRGLRRLRSEREQASLRLVVDAAGLRGEGDPPLAPRSALRLSTRIDLTDGMGGFRWARVVSLRWPQGEVPIFRSYDKAQVQALCRELAGLGIQSE
jgi:hypothetical protein